MKLEKMTDEQLASVLCNALVKYQAEKSEITNDGKRSFQIEEVTRVFTSQKGVRCVTIQAIDKNDDDASKYRTLHVDRIQSIQTH